MNKELASIYQTYVSCARGLSDINIEDCDIQYLANKYVECIDLKEEHKANQYFSALALKYFYVIFSLYNRVNSFRISKSDVAMIVAQGILYSLRSRGWLSTKNDHDKDPDGAKKCINTGITFYIKNFIASQNSQKKGDYNISYSLDAMWDCKEMTDYSENSICYYQQLIHTCLDKREIYEALILFAIYTNCSLYERKFSYKKLVRVIKNNNNFMREFIKFSDVSDTNLICYLTGLHSDKETALRSSFNKAFLQLKKNFCLQSV